jgi:hypothetical protein
LDVERWTFIFLAAHLFNLIYFAVSSINNEYGYNIRQQSVHLPMLLIDENALLSTMS